MYHYGEEGDYSVLVMELMGNSLEKLFQKYGKKFSLKTILMLVDQMIKAIEQFHAHHYIHRDIKPDNFVIGLGAKSGTIHLLDFGLSKRFRDPISGLHIPYKDHKSFTGTARYASIKTHFGIEQSRRDDLESLGHLFIYLLKGLLPWQNMPAATKKEKYEKIRQKKVSLSLDRLCTGLPIEFQAYLNYTRSMKFNERPDYAYILRIFKDLFDRKGYIYDNAFDWVHPWKKTMLSEDKASMKIPKKHLIQAPPKPSGDKENREQEGKTPTAATTLAMANESLLFMQANL
eukprot:TRINITY_DN3796_c0_g6_i2.p1 TRINITY_DN3796_c0_g6~~TRINITY_DN3796_c0_g6_i2.p1  ORF type:complete len:288 (-),score=72.34 TRINITY_DN3796_c0_g6_i2:189-1052(-)